jgi:hypothetical protein
MGSAGNLSAISLELVDDIAQLAGRQLRVAVDVMAVARGGEYVLEQLVAQPRARPSRTSE